MASPCTGIVHHLSGCRERGGGRDEVEDEQRATSANAKQIFQTAHRARNLVLTPSRCAHTQIFCHRRMIGRWCGFLGPPTAGLAAPHFHFAPRVCRPSTRTYVRLLGPCFKTGRGQAFRQASAFALALGRAQGASAGAMDRAPASRADLPPLRRFPSRPPDADWGRGRGPRP